MSESSVPPLKSFMQSLMYDMDDSIAFVFCDNALTHCARQQPLHIETSTSTRSSLRQLHPVLRWDELSNSPLQDTLSPRTPKRQLSFDKTARSSLEANQLDEDARSSGDEEEDEVVIAVSKDVVEKQRKHHISTSMLTMQQRIGACGARIPQRPGRRGSWDVTF